MKTSPMLLAAASLLALAACGKKPPKELPPPPLDNNSAAATNMPAEAGPAPGSQADFVASVVADRIFFDTDSSDVGPQDQATLRSQVAWLTKYPNTRVTIEGHCDERGTREYNIALGDRRANAAKNALAALGVSPARISTISYGKERPDALGSDESAWSKNRRAVTVTVQ
ncbi:MAG: peptidoglycan-associated lipoprotein Pal [Sphingomonadaceae bacterium]|nr:peptidoglycan-associated lipoprotein Pal [Sphingomonadaceae bacterium]